MIKFQFKTLGEPDPMTHITIKPIFTIVLFIRFIHCLAIQ
jgi:hypothetical protein